jgi:pimeloyl-ACP methyl ester carboxylesterase
MMGSTPPSPPRQAAAAVILVHGLWTPAAVFALHGHWLRREGYRVLRFGYASVRATLTENTQQLGRFIATTDAAEIHLVGHSLGGLIILDLLTEAADPRLRRVLLLGTPCLGSDCARRLAALPGMPVLLGRSIMQWLSAFRQRPLPRPDPASKSVCSRARAAWGLGGFSPACRGPTTGSWP